MVRVPGAGLAELASLFGQLQSHVLPLVEAFGIGPVNAGAGGAVEGGHSVARTCPAAVPLDVDDRHWRSWKNILRQAGVRDARVHDARHTAATLLIAQGVHIRVVQEVLGHTRVTTTERYTHVATLQMKDASERMSEALWGHA
jgi:hypothetical protein